MSKNFERWEELATLTSKEQDPAKLTELATEMNLVLNQKTSNLDPPLLKPSGCASLPRKSSFDHEPIKDFQIPFERRYVIRLRLEMYPRAAAWIERPFSLRLFHRVE